MSDSPLQGSGDPEMPAVPAYEPPKVLTRPASVTVLVVLLWIWVAMTLLGGLVLVLTGIGVAATAVADVQKALIDAGMAAANAQQIAPILGGLMIGIGIGLFLLVVLGILLAVFISKGSNVARILLTIVVALRMLGSLSTLFQGFGGPVVVGVIVELAFDVVLLWLMYNGSARRFFNDRVQA